MKFYDLIQVLWVEDDASIIPLFIEDAENFGLQLVPYSCWDDAKEALEGEYDRWSAIILDAKCKHHHNSADDAISFLGEALNGISVKAVQKGRIIPWYILTGGDESEISKSIRDDRMKWDKDWTEMNNGKKYYSKNTDTEALFKRVNSISKEYRSSKLQILEMYSNVFEAIDECNLDDQAQNELLDLLVPIHFPKLTKENDYNNRFKKARIFLECLLQSMVDHGLLPDWGDEMNTRWSSLILSGKDATKGKNRTVVVQNNAPEDPALPIAMTKIFQSMVEILPTDVHKKSRNNKRTNILDYLNSVHGSTFLLKSFALQLCDIVLWYRGYLHEHNDIEQNKKRWEIIDPSSLNLRL